MRKTELIETLEINRISQLSGLACTISRLIEEEGYKLDTKIVIKVFVVKSPKGR